MPKENRSKRTLVERVGVAVRTMGAQSVLTSAVIAEKFGLHKTDLESLDLIYLRGGACSPGQLSEATGLTSGSTTALIDRLEKAGYVMREPDKSDRRRQVVRIVPEAIEPIKAVYVPMQAAMFKLWSEYSAAELETIADFLKRSARLSVDCVARIGTVDAGTNRRTEKVLSATDDSASETLSKVQKKKLSEASKGRSASQRQRSTTK